jgi:hypothetical protein
MTEHQKARRAAKSAAFFAKRARIAAEAGDLKTARRLGVWAIRKRAEVAAPVLRFHQTMMARLDDAQKSGAVLSPMHSAIRRALREANMQGRQFHTPDELALTVARYWPGLREQVLAACA